jgi:hypothetical protein
MPFNYLKLVLLVLVSISIPVLFFWQAEIVKKKESDKIETQIRFNDKISGLQIMIEKARLGDDTNLLKRSIVVDSLAFLSYRRIMERTEMLPHVPSNEPDYRPVIQQIISVLERIQAGLPKSGPNTTPNGFDQVGKFKLNSIDSAQVKRIDALYDSVGKQAIVLGRMRAGLDTIATNARLISQLQQLQNLKLQLNRRDPAIAKYDSLIRIFQNKIVPR